MKCGQIVVLGAAVLLPLLAQGQSGSLCVRANPGHAGVFVDGKYLGPAADFRIARTYSVATGEHEVLSVPRLALSPCLQFMYTGQALRVYLHVSLGGY